jgi:hypothetical protein
MKGWGFHDTGARLAQRNDPTKNLLLGFVKEGGEAAPKTSKKKKASAEETTDAPSEATS